MGIAIYSVALVFCWMGLGLPTLGKRLLRVSCVYGAIAYLLRGAVLVLSKPHPRFGDPIPIKNLFIYGYARGIDHILRLEAIALLAVYLGLRLLGPRKTQLHVDDPPFEAVFNPLLLAYGLGWVGRLAILARGGSAIQIDASGSPIIKLAFVCYAVIAVMLATTKWWVRRTPARSWLVRLALLETAWAFLGSTKEPVLALAVGMYLFRPEPEALPRHGARSWRARAQLAAGIVLVLTAFSLVNALRTPQYSAAGASVPLERLPSSRPS